MKLNAEVKIIEGLDVEIIAQDDENLVLNIMVDGFTRYQCKIYRDKKLRLINFEHNNTIYVKHLEE
jgi:hypothetical protein